MSKDNKDPITVKDITEEVLKKLKIQEANEEKETKNAVVSGIKIIEEKIKSGGKTKWRCAICGNFIEELNESKNIKKYLSEFSAGKFKKCKKNHLNWFVVNENEIVFSAKNNLDREFNI